MTQIRERIEHQDRLESQLSEPKRIEYGRLLQLGRVTIKMIAEIDDIREQRKLVRRNQSAIRAKIIAVATIASIALVLVQELLNFKIDPSWLSVLAFTAIAWIFLSALKEQDESNQTEHLNTIATLFLRDIELVYLGQHEVLGAIKESRDAQLNTIHSHASYQDLDIKLRSRIHDHLTS